MDHSIVPSTIEHCEYIAQRMREPDKQEIWASSLAKPYDALAYSLKLSRVARTAIVDGVPLCMWGVANESLMWNIGRPWMLGTDELDTKAKTFLKYCREPVMELLLDYDKLENYVDARNTASIRWLKWLGFTIEKPIEYGAMQLPFHRFWMENKNV